jgi:glutamate racemase
MFGTSAGVAQAAAAASRSGLVGVIGTAGTIASNAYARAIQQRCPGARVVQHACPLLVPLVEEGWFDHPAAELVAREYLDPMIRSGVDVLVLGCTHYPLLSGVLQLALGPEVTLVSSAEETAKDLLRVLTELDLLRGHDAPPAQQRLTPSLVVRGSTAPPR